MGQRTVRSRGLNKARESEYIADKAGDDERKESGKQNSDSCISHIMTGGIERRQRVYACKIIEVGDIGKKRIVLRRIS